jgi:hypothetical protein
MNPKSPHWMCEPTEAAAVHRPIQYELRLQRGVRAFEQKKNDGPQRSPANATFMEQRHNATPIYKLHVVISFGFLSHSSRSMIVDLDQRSPPVSFTQARFARLPLF